MSQKETPMRKFKVKATLDFECVVEAKDEDAAIEDVWFSVTTDPDYIDVVATEED